MDNINIDFQVLSTKDPRVLTIFDYSTWVHIIDKPSIVEITLPGESTPIVHYFNKKEVNAYYSTNLNINCPNCGEDELLDLPDGIYEITVKGSPDKFYKTRKYLRTDLTQLDLDKMYINLNLLCEDKDEDLANKLTDIDLLLRAAESNVRYDNICKAQELLFKAQELIEKAKGCSGCVGV
ncbi:MAG: hypothetical protein KC414_09265 [Romboutsia sp.]|nr:hypothetical protein [Romboutsia sp.]